MWLVGDLVRLISLPDDLDDLPEEVVLVFQRALGQVFRVQDLSDETGSPFFVLWVSEDGMPTDSPLHDCLHVGAAHLEPVSELEYDSEY